MSIRADLGATSSCGRNPHRLDGTTAFVSRPSYAGLLSYAHPVQPEQRFKECDFVEVQGRGAGLVIACEWQGGWRYDVEFGGGEVCRVGEQFLKRVGRMWVRAVEAG